MIKSLLVPLDGSQASEKALPWAVDLAMKLDAKIILLRVGRQPDVFDGQDLMTMQTFMSNQETACRQYLEGVKFKLKGESSLNVGTEYGEGPASRAILDKAAELGVSIIVMNSHGRDGLARWFMGSVAEKVMRHATCPVLLVREAAVDAPAGKSQTMDTVS